MTTKWKPDGLFAGKTVAILASGPSLTQELADAVRHLPRICTRWAAKLAPDADMVIAIDGPNDIEFWPWAAENFKGLKISAIETDALPDDVLYWWHRWEMVTISEVPSHVIEFRNNGMSAMHLAAEAGAAKILLLGFDPARYEEVHAHTGFIGLTQGLDQLTTKLRAQGIEVARIETMDDVRQHAQVIVGAGVDDALPLDAAPEDTTSRNRKRK